MTWQAWLVAAITWYVATRLSFFSGLVRGYGLGDVRFGSMLFGRRFWRQEGWRVLIPVVGDTYFVMAGVIFLITPLIYRVQGLAVRPPPMEWVSVPVELSSGLASVWGALWLSSMIGLRLHSDPWSSTWPVWVHGLGIVGVLALTYELIMAVRSRRG